LKEIPANFSANKNSSEASPSAGNQAAILATGQRNREAPATGGHRGFGFRKGGTSDGEGTHHKGALHPLYFSSNTQLN